MSLNSLSDIQKHDISRVDYVLGKGLMMPDAASNSGSRKIMFNQHLEHRLALLNPEVPYRATGYEMEFGRNSSSYIQAPENYVVVGVVPKFSWIPKHHYYVIVESKDSKTISVYERKEYKHITENYGYLYDNTMLDSLKPGDSIDKGSVVQKSTSFDEYDNRMDGRNMLVMYSACEETMEDAITIRESAAKALASPLIKVLNIVINDNDIPLNLYGDNSTYKVFPDIGEDTVNSILCGFRREKKEESLYSQSYSRLRELSISDERYTVAGRVVDINVYCNAPDNLGAYQYNEQIKRYYDESIRAAHEIVDIVRPYLDQGYKMDYNLQRLYSISNGMINGKQYYSERVFSNIVLQVVLIEEIDVCRGDKLSNRYGGKGITSVIRPDELMPRTKDGKIIDVILNMCGVYGRENAGQLFEITVTFVCMKIMEFMQMQVLDVGECVSMYLDLLNIVAPSMVPATEIMLSHMTDDECIAYISQITSDEKCMYLVSEPMSENMTIDKVAQLYETFPWIKPEELLMPIQDSTGAIRYVPSRRPIIYGYQYMYRLKQYAEEKFSVTSLSATNIRNENSKSKSSNNYKALYSRTPIRFGDMETGNLIHLGAELVVQMLMLYSTSPHARRLTSELLTGDAFDVNVKLDMDSKNRNVEILNVYLKTMGLKLSFKRIPKELKSPITIDPMAFYKNPDEEFVDGILFENPNVKFDIEQEVARLLEEKNGLQSPMEFYPIEFYSFDDPPLLE